MADIVKRPWTEDEVQRLKDLYRQGVESREIAIILNRTRRSVWGKAHCLGLSHKTRDDYLYSKAEDRFISENAKTMTRSEIGKAIGRSEGSVARRAERLNIVFADPSKNAIYSKNYRFFSYPNLHNSYLAGWLASDGWIRPTSAGKPINQVGLSVSAKDRVIVEHFQTLTEYTGCIRDFDVNGYPQSELRISGVPQWINDLNTHWNLTPRKTYTLQPPPEGSLSHAQMLAYLVGLIEGDGHICIKRNTLLVSYVTASKPFALWVEALWRGLTGGKPTLSKHCSQQAYYINLYGLNARRLCQALLSVNVHGLSRKWDIAKQEMSRWSDANA